MVKLSVDYRFEWCPSFLYHPHELPDEENSLLQTPFWESVAVEIMNELPGGEAERLRKPEGVETYLCETEGSVLGFTSRTEEEQKMQSKGLGPEAGGSWWTLKSSLNQLK